MIKTLLTITILVTLTNSVTFKVWRKYICEIQKDNLANLTPSNEPETPDQEAKDKFSLAITDESNIIERFLGDNKQTYLTQDSMSFTAEQITELLKNRYGMDAGQPSEEFELIMVKDFRQMCKGHTLKVLINTTDYIVCEVYKVSVGNVETELRGSETAEADFEASLELNYFDAVYGSTGEEASMDKNTWVQQRTLGMVPLFIKDNQEEPTCTLIALHLPNGDSSNPTFTEHFNSLVDLVSSINSTGEEETRNSVVEVQHKLYDFAQSQTQLLDNTSSGELQTNQKVQILEASNQFIVSENINPVFAKAQIASQLQVNEEDMQNSDMKNQLRNIGGTEFIKNADFAMSQSLIFNEDPRREDLINNQLSNGQLNQSAQSGLLNGSQRLINSSQELQSAKNQNVFGTVNQLQDSFNASQTNLDLANGTQNSLRSSQNLSSSQKNLQTSQNFII